MITRRLLVARHGKLVAENYFGGADSSTVFDLRSVTKSVVSMLTGIAVQNGRLASIDATVGTFVATTNWQGLAAETNPTTFAGTVLTIIINDVLPAAR